jgi:hypothetical protein
MYTTKDRSVKEQIQNVCFHMNLPVFDEQRLSKLDQLWVTDGDVLCRILYYLSSSGLQMVMFSMPNPLLLDQ